MRSRTAHSLWRRPSPPATHGAVRVEGASILGLLARTYAITPPDCGCWGPGRGRYGRADTSSLFGDYDFEEKRIRIWMRTAVLGR